MPSKGVPIQQVLEQTFGLKEFRLGQKEIISSLLEGRDVLALMPTGGGKSLCYQLPAVMMGGLTVVVSPLIALMNDQVGALRSLGINAGCIHSGLSVEERRQVFKDMDEADQYLLYVSPERVHKPGFAPWLAKQDIRLFAIDEAHCVSQWGHDFRPEYSSLSLLRSHHKDVPMIALTATATPIVKGDIIRHLHLQSPAHHVYGFYRPNLYYQVEFCEDEGKKEDYVAKALSMHQEGRVLIYCGTRKKTEAWAQSLTDRGESVAFYHAGLSSKDRTAIEESYQRGDVRVLVATNAFGMGIDHPDVRLVVHTQMPGTIESYYQEVGRAGRDGEPATCLMTYSKRDKGLQSFFINQSDADERIKKQRWSALNAMVQYAEGSECRHGDILTYFKDVKRVDHCGHCDSCDPDGERRVTVKALWVNPRAEETSARKRRARDKQKPTMEPIVDDEQKLRLEVIRDWRKSYAKERDIPAFIVFSDKTMRDLVLRRPTSVDQLSRVYGLGPKKIDQFGKELVELMGSC